MIIDSIVILKSHITLYKLKEVVIQKVKMKSHENFTTMSQVTEYYYQT